MKNTLYCVEQNVKFFLANFIRPVITNTSKFKDILSWTLTVVVVSRDTAVRVVRSLGVLDARAGGAEAGADEGDAVADTPDRGLRVLLDKALSSISLASLASSSDSKLSFTPLEVWKRLLRNQMIMLIAYIIWNPILFYIVTSVIKLTSFYLIRNS